VTPASPLDPAVEIRPTLLRAVRGPNYWSRRPVIRLDLAIGAYDDVSSADVAGVPERLEAALPGLVEHRCSVGERGGFLRRLRDGTYAPHIVEHVALELQEMIGHHAGFGRARGGDAPGEYTVVFEYRHERVGLRAAASALDVVRRAFAGTLVPADVTSMLAALAAIATAPPEPAGEPHAVACGVTGGALASVAAAELAPLVASGVIAVVPPARLLHAGLPYERSAVAVVTDTALHDVPPRYREREAAERLLGVLADGLRADGGQEAGLLVAPASARDVRAYARRAGCRVAVFSATRTAREDADAVAWAADGRLWVEGADGRVDGLGVARDDVPVAAQLAARLAARAMAAGPRTPADVPR
jgi:cyanophycin synthetase